MTQAKKGKAYLLCGIAIIVLSVAFMVLNLLLFKDFLVHPVLNAVALSALLFAIVSYVKAYTAKAPVYFMLGGILLGFVVLYVLLALFIEVWWVAVIVAAALFMITALISYYIAGNKTEEIALNKSPEYKNYQERMKEKYEQAEKEDKKELPEIKSFKE